MPPPSVGPSPCQTHQPMKIHNRPWARLPLNCHIKNHHNDFHITRSYWWSPLTCPTQCNIYCLRDKRNETFGFKHPPNNTNAIAKFQPPPNPQYVLETLYWARMTHTIQFLPHIYWLNTKDPHTITTQIHINHCPLWTINLMESSQRRILGQSCQQKF